MYNFLFLYMAATSELQQIALLSIVVPNIVPWVGCIHFLLQVLPETSILALSTGAHYLKPI